MKVALELFHGRKCPDENLDGWGFQGPVLLVDYVHVTYGGNLKLGLPAPGGDGELPFVDDLVYYDGGYYGDWSVFPEALLKSEPQLAARLVPYEATKAVRPEVT